MLLLAALSAASLASLVSAQDANINYVYDDLGRLIAVVTQQGDVAVYAYDPVGNLTQIQRVNADEFPGPVAIIYFTPSRGRAGASVTVFGKGFSPTPALNTLRFNGTPATVIASEPNRMTTTVPAGATTGPLSVTAPLGSATSLTSFTIGGVLAISPTTASVAVNGTQQFSATEGGTATTAVTWSVNGVTGGDPTVGTISTDGLFTAPAKIPATTSVTVAATHQEDRTTSASATVTITPPSRVGGYAHRLSVRVNQPLTVGQNVGSAVSVRVPDPLFVQTPAVSFTRAPVITGVSPSSVPRGSATLTLTGVGLEGATATDLHFLLTNNTADGAIQVTQLDVQAGGASATAQITIESTATLGDRIVQITVLGAESTHAATGLNVLTVTGP